MRALFVLILLAACSPHAQPPVGPLRNSWECSWDADTRNYQTHIVYHAASGERLGHSAGAGDCTPTTAATAREVMRSRGSR